MTGISYLIFYLVCLIVAALLAFTKELPSAAVLNSTPALRGIVFGFGFLGYGHLIPLWASAVVFSVLAAVFSQCSQTNVRIARSFFWVGWSINLFILGIVAQDELLGEPQKSLYYLICLAAAVLLVFKKGMVSAAVLNGVLSFWGMLFSFPHGHPTARIVFSAAFAALVFSSLAAIFSRRSQPNVRLAGSLFWIGWLINLLLSWGFAQFEFGGVWG